MPIVVRPIVPRDRTRKKLGRRGPPKPTKLGKIEQRPPMTIGQRERLRAISRERNKNKNPDGSDMTIQQRSRNMRLRDLGMLTGGQIKIAKKAPPFDKINEKDFAVLRAEKAKGRGQGLQDEKMKPGKVMKADKGGMGEATKYKKYLKGLKEVTNKSKLQNMKKNFFKSVGVFPGVKKMNTGKNKEITKKFLKSLNPADTSSFIQRRMKLGGARALEAAKATRIGKIAAGVAGAALLGKAALEKMYEKRTGKKPFTKRPAKKMGGGMMMQRPMGYDKGGVGKTVKAYALAEAKKDKDRLTERDISTAKKIVSKKMGGGLTEATQRLKAQGKMGGGMMMRPNPVGMKSGKSVKVKCKLGRNKPTKMY